MSTEEKEFVELSNEVIQTLSIESYQAYLISECMNAAETPGTDLLDAAFSNYSAGNICNPKTGEPYKFHTNIACKQWAAVVAHYALIEKGVLDPYKNAKFQVTMIIGDWIRENPRAKRF